MSQPALTDAGPGAVRETDEVAATDLRELAPAQQRFWLTHELFPGRPVDTVAALFRLRGRLDEAALEAALDAVCARHEAWRTTFHTVGDQPRRRVHPPGPQPLLRYDLSELEPGPREVRRRELARELARRPFDLTRLPLVRLALINLGPDEHDLLIAFPHAVGDGFSLFWLLPRELEALYPALARGEPSPLPAPRAGYEDFVRLDLAEHQGPSLEQKLAFWRAHLAGAPAALELPLDLPRPGNFDPAGARCERTLPPDRARRLAQLVRPTGASLGDALQALWAVLLHRYTNATDLVVGTPLHNRVRPELQDVFGCCMTTVACRTDLGGDPGFLELVGRVRAEREAYHPYRTLSLQGLLSGLPTAPRDPSRNPVYQVLFNFLRFGGRSFPLGPDLSLEVQRLDPGRAMVDLNLDVADTPEGLTLCLEYATRLFRPETAARILSHYANLLDAVLAAPEAPISRLPLLSAAERRQLLEEWNATRGSFPTERLMHQLFEAQAAARPEAVALACGQETLSYGQLEAAANRLAHRLQALGAGPGVLVGICLGRSFRMVEAMLGVLKAGAAYAPLDPAYPEDRLAFMLEDTQAPVVITERALAGRLPASARLLVLEDEDATLAGLPTTPPPCLSTVDHLAYVIYTSGSTGRPKGVIVRHRPALNLIDWVNSTFQVGPQDRLLFVTSMNFDLSVYDVFGVLGAGGSLRIATSQELREPERLVEWLESGEITFWDSAPPALVQLRPFFPAHPGRGRLRLVFLSGDWIPVPLPDQVRAAWPGAQVVSLGGATEATVWSNWYAIGQVDRSWPSIPYGRPIRNARYYVLDRHLQPQPVGIPGELFIAGPCLSDGYLNRPELNAEKFLPDPLMGAAGERMYRTGDLARFFPDGNIEFLGRIDHQVKVRGFRIELGEIEAVLNTAPGVQGSLVLAPKDASGERNLVGYVLCAQTGWNEAAVREHARGKLPEYMVPTYLVRLDAFPLTSNGKVDRAALPAPERARVADYVAPVGELEEQVAGVWAEVLDLPRVGRRDDFFSLGGHSLLATRVIGRLREAFGLQLPVRTLFDATTVERFARVVAEVRAGTRSMEPSSEAREALESESGELSPAEGVRLAPLSPSQEVFWYQSRVDPSSTAYVIQTAIRLEGPLDSQHLRQAVNALVARHEPLRTGFVLVGGEVRQKVTPPAPVDLPEQELEGGDLVPAARRALRELARVPFELSSPPLLRGRIVRGAPDDCVLLLVIHHIVADGWSLGLIQYELGALLAALREGRPVEQALPALESTYRDYARWHRRRLRGQRERTLLDYWGQRLRELPPPLSLAEERLLASPPGRGSARVVHDLPPALSAAVRRHGLGEGATPFMVLLAAFQLVLQRWSGREDVVLGTPVAGRERPEHEPLVGCFVNSTVLRVQVDPQAGFRQLLRVAREAALGALAHADLPFPQLVRHVCPQRGREERNPLFEVFFNYLTPARQRPPGIAGVRMDLLETQDVLHKFELTLYVHEEPERFRLELVHDADRLSSERAAALAAQLEHVLARALEEPDRPVSELPLVGHDPHLPDPAAPLDPERGEPITASFLRQVQAHPERTAVAFAGGRSWTYGQLQARAEEVARRLIQAGVRPGDVVAVHAARAPALVPALLGVLEAGAAWAILDPAHPGPRLARCLQVARPRALLLLEEAGPLAPALAAAAQPITARVSVPADPPPARGAGPALPAVGADALAYVAFTSGSTGVPKAVAGEHRPVAHFLAWQASRYQLGPEDRFALLAGLGHDPLLRDLFAPLGVGGTVCVPGEGARRDPTLLLSFLREQRVSVLHLTPALGQLLAAAPGSAGALPGLRLAFFGGDRLRGGDAARLQQVAPRVRCVNLYGTTETPQGVGFYEVDQPLPERAPAPIGRGIEDVQLLVLGPRGRACAPGELGEICVRTPYLTRGYLGEPGPGESTTTAAPQRFVPGPARVGPWDRMYRTGDLGRYDAAGQVEFVGRGGDGQVQVRGYRVELGEVEGALLSRPGVARAVVRLCDDRLVAWVVAPGLSGPSLRHALMAELPEPMVPAAVEVLEAFPLTPNGKVDVASLPAPGLRPDEPQRENVEPRTQTESEIAGLWRELLGREFVGVEDDFFQLGGHSLLAVRMLSLLGERLGGVALPVGLLMRAPTVGALARALHEQAWVDEEPLVVPIQLGQPGALPFWIIHPIGGHVVFAHRVARHLDRGRPLYGIQARGLDGHSPPFLQVEPMAAHYVQLLREVQPEGPYCLGGPSFGGTVAFEMAQQLVRAGQQVAVLALFDTFGPGYPDSKDMPARVADHFGHLFRLTWRQRLDYVRERLNSRLAGRDQRWKKYDVQEAEAHGQLVDAVRQVIDANYRASTAYAERPYPGRVQLFRALHRPVFPGKTFSDPTNGWHRVALRGVDVIEVDCTHQTIMDEPGVTTVGRELDRLLRAVDTSKKTT